MEFHLVQLPKIKYCFRDRCMPNPDLSEFKEWNPIVKSATGEDEGEGDLWKVCIIVKDIDDLVKLQKRFGEITLRGEFLVEVRSSE